MSSSTAGGRRQQAPNSRKDHQKSVIAYVHPAGGRAERRTRPARDPRGRARALSAPLDRRSTLRWPWLWVTPVPTAPTPLRGPAPPCPDAGASAGGASP
ncbi:hypothetical protein [Frankia sp. CiP1_Cm_nod1]|uniref:hypothetical protein n=1 Tax=Frankia sp. CiP1_Cm_nod1 TaxID=2897160 RepID=UPI002024A96E